MLAQNQQLLLFDQAVGTVSIVAIEYGLP